MFFRRKLMMVLFGLGAAGGFGWEYMHHHGCHSHRRQAFEDRVADVCVRAADRHNAAMNGMQPDLRGPGWRHQFDRDNFDRDQDDRRFGRGHAWADSDDDFEQERKHRKHHRKHRRHQEHRDHQGDPAYATPSGPPSPDHDDFDR